MNLLVDIHCDRILIAITIVESKNRIAILFNYKKYFYIDKYFCIIGTIMVKKIQQPKL